MSTEKMDPKKRGRPQVDSEGVKVRMERADLDRIDEFAERQGLKGRPEAIRRLVRAALYAYDDLPRTDQQARLNSPPKG